MERVCPEPRYLRPDQVAAILAVSTDTVYRYIREGRLPAARLGGHVGNALRIPVEGLKGCLVRWGDREAKQALRNFLT